MNKAIARSWTFASKSNPNKKHETLQYVDGTTSCQCMGWTRQIKPDGSRSCTHTRMIESGLADSECVASQDFTMDPYQKNSMVSPIKPIKQVQKPKKVPVKEEPTESRARVIARRIRFE
jgi:hypothetical protein